MKKTKKGSAAPKKQQTLEEKYECYTVDRMPLNVKTRSKGAVTCEKDIVKAVKTLMEGDVIVTPRSLSQLTTSFIGSQCQGIRPAPFLA